MTNPTFRILATSVSLSKKGNMKRHMKKGHLILRQSIRTLVAKMGKADFVIFPPKWIILAINLKFLHGRRPGQILGLSLPKIKWWKTYCSYVFIYCLDALQRWGNHNFATGYSLFMSEIFTSLKIFTYLKSEIFNRYSRIHHRCCAHCIFFYYAIFFNNKNVFPFENPLCLNKICCEKCVLEI